MTNIYVVMNDKTMISLNNFSMGNFVLAGYLKGIKENYTCSIPKNTNLKSATG
ncbi:MAG: hypothetical protein QM495_09555 [Lutibacter sp.]|uniref:hypothetical protein n=1 Tax=Lutibacter sp. TaxID=1925666 RepID=UPI00385AF5F9